MTFARVMLAITSAFTGANCVMTRVGVSDQLRKLGRGTFFFPGHQLMSQRVEDPFLNFERGKSIVGDGNLHRAHTFYGVKTAGRCRHKTKNLEIVSLSDNLMTRTHRGN